MNNIATIEQENPQREKFLISTVNELCESVDSVMIFSRPDLSHATDLLKMIKQRYKEFDGERTGMVKPFNEGVKKINARFKSILEPLEKAETELKSKMVQFQDAEEKRTREEAKIAVAQAAKQAAEETARQQKDAEEASDGEYDRAALPEIPPPTPIVIPQHKPTTYGQTGAVSTVKKQWTFELVDIKALAAARPDLVQVDPVKINQEIRGRGGDIPGLRIFEKSIIQVK